MELKVHYESSMPNQKERLKQSMNRIAKWFQGDDNMSLVGLAILLAIPAYAIYLMVIGN